MTGWDDVDRDTVAADLDAIIRAYATAPPTRARTAVLVIPGWMADQAAVLGVDPADIADDLARTYGFAGARLEIAR